MFSVDPLPGNHKFGAVVQALNPDDLDSEDVRRRLYDLWVEKGVLVFSGVPGGRETQLKLSRVFGECELHPVLKARLPECPEILPLVYEPGKKAVTMVDGQERGGYLPWHSDLIYHDTINRGGLLRAVVIPSEGGQTGFIDQIDLYDQLPEDLKRAVEGKNIVYHFEPAVKRFGKPMVFSERAEMMMTNPQEFPLVAHPIVFPQRETGRKVLNVSPWFAVCIEDMDPDESDTLMSRIMEHCEQDSRAYYHQWQENDMVLWDNWRMMHSAPGLPKHEHRRMERTTLKGDYELGRVVGGTKPREHVPVV